MSHVTEPVFAVLIWASVLSTLLLFFYLAIAIYRTGGFRIGPATGE